MGCAGPSRGKRLGLYVALPPSDILKIANDPKPIVDAGARLFEPFEARAHSYLTRFTGKERVNFQVLNLRIVKWPNPLLWCGGSAFSMITR